MYLSHSLVYTSDKQPDLGPIGAKALSFALEMIIARENHMHHGKQGGLKVQGLIFASFFT